MNMATSLYRKHRPQVFGDITGQRHIMTTLQHQLELDRVAHAYLFAGPRGTGKTTTSRVLAKAVNCTRRKTGTAEPCNACTACASITVGNALDVLEIDAASHTGVDHVREHIIGNTRVSPSSLRWKVFIIDEVHMLSLAAFNALLKTLEEPPPNVLFILATTEVGKLPPTIVSRCQRFDFRKISAEDMAERLVAIIARERRQVADGVVAAIVANADGSVRDAESLLEQVFALGDDPITLDQARLVIPYTDVAAVMEMLAVLSKRQTPAALEHVNRLANAGTSLTHFADEVTEWLRRVLLLRCGASVGEVSVGLTAAQGNELAAVAGTFSLPVLVSALGVWMSRAAEVRLCPIPQLPLELAIIEICQPGGASANTPAQPNTETAVAPASARGRARALSRPPDATAKTAVKTTTKKTAPKAAAIPAPEPPPVTAPAVSLDQITAVWASVLTQVKTQNYSLFSLLRVMRPIEVVGDAIKIGVAYDFHLERLRELKNRLVLERALEQALGTALRVEGVVMPATSQPGYVAEDTAMQSLLENFGGKIVE